MPLWRPVRSFVEKSVGERQLTFAGKGAVELRVLWVEPSTQVVVAVLTDPSHTDYTSYP